jgi:hypothetical protein
MHGTSLWIAGTLQGLFVIVRGKESTRDDCLRIIHAFARKVHPMEAEEIISGQRYWVMQSGEEMKVEVRSRERGSQWICELEPNGLVLMLPLSAFVRAAAPS